MTLQEDHAQNCGYGTVVFSDLQTSFSHLKSGNFSVPGARQAVLSTPKLQDSGDEGMLLGAGC